MVCLHFTTWGCLSEGTQGRGLVQCHRSLYEALEFELRYAHYAHKPMQKYLLQKFVLLFQPRRHLRDWGERRFTLARRGWVILGADRFAETPAWRGHPGAGLQGELTSLYHIPFSYTILRSSAPSRPSPSVFVL